LAINYDLILKNKYRPMAKKRILGAQTEKKGIIIALYPND
tara:strand:- start:2 stop:121 length:120 start_codon:yes stop_codon:yes gene_type:complete